MKRVIAGHRRLPGKLRCRLGFRVALCNFYPEPRPGRQIDELARRLQRRNRRQDLRHFFSELWRRDGNRRDRAGFSHSACCFIKGGEGRAGFAPLWLFSTIARFAGCLIRPKQAVISRRLLELALLTGRHRHKRRHRHSRHKHRRNHHHLQIRHRFQRRLPGT